MNLKDIFNTLKMKRGKNYFSMYEVSSIISDEKLKNMFIEHYSGNVILNKHSYRFCISTVIPAFKIKMNEIESFNMMDGSIIFVSNNRIIYSIKVNKKAPFAYSGLLHTANNVALKYSTSNINACIKLILLNMIANKY